MSIDNKAYPPTNKDIWPWDQDQKGWTCPKCGTVYSPYVNTCFRCSNPPVQPTPSNPWVKPEHTPVEYPWNIDVWDSPITF